MAGFKKNNPGCDCCVEDCANCQGGTTPSNFQVDVPAGTFTNGCGSGDCAGFEGSLLLTPRVGFEPCQWQVVVAGVCDGNGTVKMILTTNLISLDFSHPALANFAAFEKSITSPYDCSATHVLTWGGNDPGALCPSGSGKTITLNP